MISMSSETKTIGVKGMRWMIWSIYIIMVITIIIAWVFYPQFYYFWEQPTSHLGGLRTLNSELDNFPSILIFSTGFVILGIVAIAAGALYFKHVKKFRFAILKGVLLVIMGIGAIGIAIPHDYTPMIIFHQIGAFMFLSSLAALNAVFQVIHCLAKYGYHCEDKKVDYYVDYTFVILLIGAAVTYYATEVIHYVWPAGWWIKPPMMQKILLFTAIIAAGLLDLDDIK